MALLYERKETENEIIIRYKYYPLVYITLIVAVILGIGLDQLMGALWGDIFFTFCMLLFVIFIIDIWKPSKEVRKAMEKNAVQMSGSKFSFSNPLTVIIKKKS